MCSLNFASKLWGLFKALISGALSEVDGFSREEKASLMAKIDQKVVNYFIQVMQMDSFTLWQKSLNDCDSA